jgi:hypothetical protein
MAETWRGDEHLQWNDTPDVVGIYRVRVRRARPQDGGAVWHYFGVPMEVISALSAPPQPASLSAQDLKCPECSGFEPDDHE